MSTTLQYTIVDDIKCYSLAAAEQYTDYPDDGFDVTDKLEEESFWVRSRNRLFKAIISEHVAKHQARRFLEIGCGTGAFIEALGDQGGLGITGSEIYIKGLRYAKRRQPGVDFIQYDAQQGVLPAKFDIIAAFDVIEHIEDDRATIANIHQMLTDGGHFILTVPQHKFLWSKLDQIVKHKRRYTRRELAAKLEEQGFEVVRTTSFVFLLFPLMAISRLLDRPARDTASLEGQFEQRVGFPRALNWIFDKCMRVDEALIRGGASLPFGGTLVAIAKKPVAKR